MKGRAAATPSQLVPAQLSRHRVAPWGLGLGSPQYLPLQLWTSFTLPIGVSLKGGHHHPVDLV